jgi:hypothetical protein
LVTKFPEEKRTLSALLTSSWPDFFWLGEAFLPVLIDAHPIFALIGFCLEIIGREGGGLGLALALAWGEAGIRIGFGLDWIRIINCFCFDKKEVAWLDLGFGI